MRDPRAGAVDAAPTGGDPTDGQFVPPKINNANKPESSTEPATNDGSAAEPNAAAPIGPATPPVGPKPSKPKFGEDDDDKKEGSIGPRLELQEKVAWRRVVSHHRQDLSAIRVSATVNRSALFPKMAWKTTRDSELAKK